MDQNKLGCQEGFLGSDYCPNLHQTTNLEGVSVEISHTGREILMGATQGYYEITAKKQSRLTLGLNSESAGPRGNWEWVSSKIILGVILQVSPFSVDRPLGNLPFGNSFGVFSE